MLQILQGTGNDSQLVKDAQKLLEQLEEQSKTLADELGGLESEIQPLQDELEKRLDELRVARATLKQNCNVQALGTAGASWKENWPILLVKAALENETFRRVFELKFYLVHIP